MVVVVRAGERRVVAAVVIVVVVLRCGAVWHGVSVGESIGESIGVSSGWAADEASLETAQQATVDWRCRGLRWRRGQSRSGCGGAGCLDSCG